MKNAEKILNPKDLQQVALLKMAIQPNYIWYADKPPLLGGKAQKLTIEEFEKKFPGFHYAENIFAQKNQLIDVSRVKNTENVQSNARIRERLRQPNNDKLILCYIDEEVGHGLFARKAIKIGEIVAIYSGILYRKGDRNIFSNYDTNISPIEDNEQDALCIDAEKIGGLSRFMQHLPSNPDDLTRLLIAHFARFPNDVDQYIRTLPDMDLPKAAIREVVENIKKEVQRGKSSILHGMHHYKSKEQGAQWEFDSLNFDSITPDEIAWSNVHQFPTVIDGVPLVVFQADRAIAEGEQLGGSYGIAFWHARQTLPLLFDRAGRVIEKNKYHYHRIPVTVQLGEIARIFPFSQKQYTESQVERFPVQVTPGSHPHSFFVLRKMMVKQRVIGQAHAVLQPNSFALRLKQLLPSNCSIELFNRYPDSQKESEQWLVDAVITAPNKELWESLTLYFRASNIASYCKCFQFTLEIMVSGVNTQPQAFQEFLKELEAKPEKLSLTHAFSTLSMRSY